MSSLRISAQNSFDLLGGLSNSGNSHFRLNSFEINRSNLSGIKDWEFSVIYGGEFTSSFNGNLYQLSLSKKLDDHYFNIRYTPGYQKDFIFNSGTTINIGDTLATQLKSQFHYSEVFGIGYSHPIARNISAGVTFRYLKEEFTNDQASLRYDNNTTSIIVRSITEPYSFWIGDLGVNYFPSENLNLIVSTINLLSSHGTILEENKQYDLKTDKSLLFGLDYQISKRINTKFFYELNNSFQVSGNLGFGMPGGYLSFSLDAFHDKYQTPFIAGIIPGINFSTDLLSVTISGVKYLQNRNRAYSISEFTDKGLHNILNNNYSSDKVMVTVNFALNTVEDKVLKFIDVNVVQDIFPTLTDKYIDNPFAYAKVVNLSDKPVSVKPYCTIPELNQEKIQSPAVVIAPKDTAQIPYYIIINGKDIPVKRTEISQASFFISSGASEDDDEFHKPVLINDINSWDGKVANLRYFVWKDLDYSLSYAKRLIQSHKQELDTLPSALTNFYITSILFNDYVKHLVYVSDPRASVNRVQFPSETISLKGGACDDLSVGFSSLLESVGIETAFVDFKADSAGISHVNLLVNTGLLPEQASFITNNDKKYVLRKNTKGQDELWIPLEMTSLTNFNKAWEIAAEKFNDEAIDSLGLAKGKVQIVDIF